MPETLTRARIVERLHHRVGLTRSEAGLLVDDVFRILCDTLEGGEQVKISGFGVFQVRAKAPRRGRNPATREALIIGQRRVLTFKPSGVLRRRLNPDRDLE